MSSIRLRPLDLAVGVLVLALGAGVGAGAAAADRKAPAPPDYGQDVISVAHGQAGIVPTGDCIVWANAEGLGVGRQQLNGYHGVTLHLDLKPVGQDGPRPTAFADGLAQARSRFPDAPAWLFKALEDNRAGIEAACGEDHDTPFVVHKLVAADRAK